MEDDEDDFECPQLDLLARKIFSVKSLGAVATLVIIAVLINRSYTYIERNDCYGYIRNGQWLGDRWYPYQCILLNHPSESLMQYCTSSKEHSRNHVTFLGESTLALFFKWLADSVDENTYVLPYNIAKSSPLQFTSSGRGKAQLITEMHWEPEYLHTGMFDYYTKLIDSVSSGKENSAVSSDIIVHHYRNFVTEHSSNPRNTQDEVVFQCKAYQKKLHELQKTFLELTANRKPFPPILVVLMSDLDVDKSTADFKCSRYTENSYMELSKNSSELRSRLAVIHTPGKILHQSLMERLGKQTKMPHAPPGMVGLAHFVCNSREFGTCCLPTDVSYYNTFMLPLLVVIMAVHLGLWLVKLTGANLPLITYFEMMSIDLDYIYTIINVSGVVTIALIYSCLCERLEYFPSAGIWRSIILFMLLCFAVLCLGFITRYESSKSEHLNREQMVEWRGLLVLLLITLEYTDVKNTRVGLWAYLLVLASMVFVTGYGNFLYFWNTGDFSWRRVVKVLWRQNYLVIFMCLTLHTPYSVYTIPALTTIGFLIVYATMAIKPQLTLENMRGFSMPNVVLITKLTVVFIIITAMTTAKNVFDYWHIWPMRNLVINSEASLDKWQELAIATRYMALSGMIVAYVSLAAKSKLLIFIQSTRALVPICSILLFILYMVFALKCSYTETSANIHSVLVILPILAYAILRNMTMCLKSEYSAVYHYCGSMAVEMYVLFQHIMVSHIGKGIIALFPGYYSISLLSCIVIWWFLSLSISTAARIMTSYSKPVTDDEDV